MGARPLLPHAHRAGTKPRRPQHVQLGFVSSSSAQMFGIPLAPAWLASPPIPKFCLWKLSTSAAEPTQPIALGHPRPPGDVSGCSVLHPSFPLQQKLSLPGFAPPRDGQANAGKTSCTTSGFTFGLCYVLRYAEVGNAFQCLAVRLWSCSQAGTIREVKSAFSVVWMAPGYV